MRLWKSDGADDGSIHCLGNGRLCVYEQGPNAIQIFGPPYSAPVLGRLTLESEQPIASESIREAGAAIWTHRIAAGSDVVGEMVDFVDAELPCFVRRVRASVPLRFRLTLQSSAIQMTDNGGRFAAGSSLEVPGTSQVPGTWQGAGGEQIGGCLCEIAPGAPFYSRYPFPGPVCYQIAWRGRVAGARSDDGSGLGIVCGPGESWLFVAGGPSYPAVIETAEAALTRPSTELLARTRHWWQQFTGGRRELATDSFHSTQDKPFDGPRPGSSPTLRGLRVSCASRSFAPSWSSPWAVSGRSQETAPTLEPRLLQAVDDVAILIKTQQAAEGGVLAGHNYHLCYVRDQYGVARGLLALGHLAEAQAILDFYWRIWQRHGRIHNAQAAGVDGAFHVHENDEVEITGYLVRQAFDLVARTGDDTFLGDVFPMLEWAWEAQKRHLIDGMLPFNGDETYVAGGILPRTALNDGSAEATLLLIDGGEKLVEWAGRHHRWSSTVADENRNLLTSVKARYRDNFWRDGRLITNNPRRAQSGLLPRFRHGVCERCAAEQRARSIEWTERSAAGRYLCPRCLAEGPYIPAESQPYHLQSVSLTPLYFRSDLFAGQELAPVVEGILRRYQATGSLPSRPDDEKGMAVGYDYGFLLYAIVELGELLGADMAPIASELYERTLSLADPTGAWVEYYLHHRPTGTRYRPWESAINIEALLHYATRHS